MGVTFTYKFLPAAPGTSGQTGLAGNMDAAGMDAQVDVETGGVETSGMTPQEELELLYQQGRESQGNAWRFPSLEDFFIEAAERDAHLVPPELLRAATQGAAASAVLFFEPAPLAIGRIAAEGLLAAGGATGGAGSSLPPTGGAPIGGSNGGNGTGGGERSFDILSLAKYPRLRPILDRAIISLRRNANKRSEGKIPTKAEIFSALISEHKDYTGGAPASDERRELDELAESVHARLQVDQGLSNRLRITGTKEPPKKEPRPDAIKPGRKPKSADVMTEPIARRVATALSLLPEIERFAGNIPDHYAAQIEAAGDQLPESLVRSAKLAAARLKTLGMDDNLVAAKLADPEARRSALEDVKNLEEIRAKLRSMFHESSIIIDREGVSRFLGFINPDIAEWASELPDDLKLAEPLFRRFIENYVGFWLGEMEGRSPTRLTVSNDAAVDAIIKTRRDLKGTELPKNFDALAKGMVDYIVTKEAWRDRLATSEASGAGGATHQPAIARSITSEAELGAQIGERLLTEYKKFFNDIMDGRIASVAGLNERERRDLSLRWREAFVYITRFGAGNYGDNYNEEHIITNGLEPRLVRPLFRRLKDARIYTDRVLEFMRQFYLQRLGVGEEKVPKVEQLKPAFIGPGPVVGGGIAEDTLFVPYDSQRINEEGMAGYLRGMEFVPVGDEAFEDEFRDATDITWQTFLRYGSLRQKPAEMSQQMLETLVDEVIEPAELERFLLDHPPNDIDWTDWQGMVDTAAEQGSLKELVFRRGFKTNTVTGDDWRRYTEYSIQNGHPEDVTVGPTSERAYLGILRAYRFLNERAEQVGRRLDVIDFISAISPVLRRMREAAADGVILLGIPAFMRSIPFRNIGQPTLAQQIKATGLLTRVHDSTFAAWLTGEVRNPTYREMRKNAASVAAQSHGGRDIEENLYNLQVVFRYMFILWNYALILNPLGGRESYIAEESPTRFILRLVKDISEYERGSPGSRIAGMTEEVIIKARSGYYDRLIEGVRDYLLAVKRLPFRTEVTLFDGRIVTIDDYLEKLREMESLHIFDGTALKGQTSLLSVDQIEEIKQNYRRLSEFAQEVYFLMRVRGEAAVTGDTIPFDAAPQIKGHRYDSSSLGRVVLFLDDIEPVAQREGWPETRKEALLITRLIAGRLLLKNEITSEEALQRERLETAIRPYWQPLAGLFDQAIADFIELEQGASRMRLADGVDVTRRAEGWHAGSREPVLPWWAPRWTEQFKIFAESRGVEAGDIEKIERALAEYFGHVKTFYKTFFPNTLRGAIERQFGKRATNKIGNAFDLAKEFLPTVGTRVAGQTPASSSRRMTTEEIAGLAVGQYAAFFNIGDELREQLPIDEDLLRDITNLLCIEHNELEATRVFEDAKRQLIAFNVGRRESPLVAAGGEEEVPVKGHVLERLRAFAQQNGIGLKEANRAYFDALPQIVGAGLSPRPSGEGAEPLPYSIAEFLTQESARIGEWRRLVTDNEYGFVRFVRDKYNAPYFTDERLLKFAERYGVSVLAIPEGADLVGLSQEAVASTYAPYADITDKMARFYRILLGSYLKYARGEFHDTMELVVQEVDTAAAGGDIARVKTPELLAKEALRRLGMEKGELDKIEGFNALIEELYNAEERIKGLEAKAKDVFDEKVSPRIDAVRRRAEGLNTEIAAEEKKITEFAKSAFAISLEEYVSDPSELTDEAACDRVLAVIERSLAIIAGLDGSRNVALKAAEEAERKARELRELGNVGAGLSPRPYIPREGAFREMFNDAVRQISPIKSQLEADWKSVTERRAEIRLENHRKAAAVAATELEGELDSAIASYDFLAEILKRDFVEPVRAVMARLDGFVVRNASYDEFVADVSTITNIRNELEPFMGVPDRMREEAAKIGEEGLFERIPALAAWVDGATYSNLTNKREGLKAKKRSLEVPQDLQTIADDTNKEMWRKIREAEKGLPIRPMAERLWVPPVALPEGEVIIIEGYEVRFNSDRPNKDYRVFIGERLNEIISSKVVSLMNGSTVISPQTARRIAEWQGTEGEEIEFEDMFVLKVKSGSVGMRLIEPADHPQMAKVVRALSLIVDENSHEGYLVAQLLKKRQQGELERSLVVSLFSTIANEPEAQDAAEAKRLIGRWALASGGPIQHALGQRAKMLFNSTLVPVAGAGAPGAVGSNTAAPETKEPSELVKWWEAEYGTSYADEMREGSLAYVNHRFERSLWGQVSIADAQVAEIHYVEPESYAAFMRGEREKVFVYDRIGPVKEADLRELLGVGDVKYTHPLADNPTELARIRLEQRIHTDPDLRPLSWVLWQTERIGPSADNNFNHEFYTYIWHMLDGDFVDLLEAQNRILTEYRNIFVDNMVDAPEVTKIPGGDVIKWVKFGRTVRARLANIGLSPERIGERAIARANGIIEGNADAMNTYRMLMILSETIFNPLPDREGTADEEFVKSHIYDTMAGEDVTWNWKDEFTKVKDFYLKHRPEVLKQRHKLEEMAQGISPHQLPYLWDEEVNKRFSEVGWVRDPLVGRTVNGTMEGCINGAFGGFPSLAEMLTLILVAHRLRRLPEVFERDFKRAMDNYTSTVTKTTNADSRDELDRNTREKLIELYGMARPAVIEMLKDIQDPAKFPALQKELGREINFAGLMKRANAWEPRPKGWEGHSPMARLKAVVPEYFVVRPEVAEIMATMLGNLNKTMGVLAEKFPAIGSIWTVSGFLPMSVEEKERFDREVQLAFGDGGDEGEKRLIEWFAGYLSQPILVFRTRQFLDSKILKDERSGSYLVGTPEFEQLNSHPEFQRVWGAILSVVGARPGQRLRDVLLESGLQDVAQGFSPAAVSADEDIKFWEELHGAEYTEVKHRENHKAAGDVLDDSLLGILMIQFHDGSTHSAMVTPQSYAEFNAGSRDDVLAYDRARGPISVALRDVVKDKGQHRVVYNPPLADNPRELNKHRFARRVFGDTALRPLGWLINQAFEGGPEADVANIILNKFADNNGSAPSTDIQGKALASYRRYKETGFLPETAGDMGGIDKMPTTWEGIPPLERLRAVVPEYFSVRKDIVDNLARINATGVQIRDVEMVHRFGHDFPELSAFEVLFDTLVTGGGMKEGAPVKVAKRYAAAVMDGRRSGQKVDREAFIKEFVDACLDPVYVRALRQALAARLVEKDGHFDIEGGFFAGLDRSRIETVVSIVKNYGGKPGQTIRDILLDEGRAETSNVPIPIAGSLINPAEYPELDEISHTTLNSFVDRVYSGFSEGVREEIGSTYSQFADIGVARLVAGVKTLIQKNPEARRHLTMIMLLNKVEDEEVEKHISSIFADTGGARRLMDGAMEGLMLSEGKGSKKVRKHALSVLADATGAAIRLASPTAIEKTIGFYRKHIKNKGGR